VLTFVVRERRLIGTVTVSGTQLVETNCKENVAVTLALEAEPPTVSRPAKAKIKCVSRVKGM